MVHLYIIATNFPIFFEYLPLYSIKLYINIILPMSLALSVYVLFISRMESVNGIQFLNTIFLRYYLDCLLFVGRLLWCLKQVNIHHYNHINLILTIEVLNLIWLPMLYTPCDSSCMSTQFFALNLGGWRGVLSNKFIIFWYYIIILL